MISWAAAASTIIGAALTAANLKARVTGIGFVFFFLASSLWVVHALTSEQQSLLWANVFLVFINAIGVWRWLFMRAKLEKGASRAERRSAASESPTLRAASALIGASVEDRDGRRVGEIVDYLVRRRDFRPEYFVLRWDNALYAVEPRELRHDEDCLRLNGESALQSRRPIADDDWPSALSRGQIPER